VYESNVSGVLISFIILQGEYDLWKQKWSASTEDASRLSTATAALQSCSQVVFPNIYSLLRILAVLPVTTAEPERVFSKVEKTLTSLRSTMGEERLEALVLLEVHRDRTPSTASLIDAFALGGARKLNFIL